MTLAFTITCPCLHQLAAFVQRVAAEVACPRARGTDPENNVLPAIASALRAMKVQISGCNGRLSTSKARNPLACVWSRLDNATVWRCDA
jgi:hypothetical protein